MKLNKIAILLSTYNGEKYLSEQLDSIMNQTCQNFTLYIRDDGSKDNTISIINGYCQKYPNQIRFIEDNKGNLGVEKSFRELVKIADADYYFFCDQDDIWNENKLNIFINFFQNNSQKQAHLIYSNFTLINEKGNIINKKAFKGIRKNDKINKGAFVNLVPGCFMSFNNLAKDLYLSYTNYPIHDELIFVLTSVYGKISIIDKPLVKYRIHNFNTIGLSKNKLSSKSYIKEVLKYFFNNIVYRNIALKSYLSLVNETRKLYPLKKEFYNEAEINKLSYFKRKIWFYNHFFPFQRGGLANGFRELLLI